MRTRVLILACCLTAASTLTVVPTEAQQETSPPQAANPSDVEGAVVSASQSTLVVRTDDNQFHLFTYDRGVVRAPGITPGARVRVSAGPPDDNGTRVASNVSLLSAAPPGAAPTDKTTQAAPMPEKVRDVESEIKRES